MAQKHEGFLWSGAGVTLKYLAEHLQLNPATVSVILNDVPGRSIPQATRDRVKAAAHHFNYHPSHVARALRSQKGLAIGVLVPELGDGYHTQVMSGVSDLLLEKGYLYFIAQHRHQPALIEQYAHMLLCRGAEGLLAIDTLLERGLRVPVVVVAGHRAIVDVTNVILDHHRAAELSLRHLYDLGHRRIAFMRGQPFSSDSEERWNCTVATARALGLVIEPELVVQLHGNISSPELGYPVADQLLGSSQRFTALLAFNDLSAIGAIRALQDKGLRVPEDVSVVGFDDITGAAYHNPRLTTIRQPLHTMGRCAAELLMGQLRKGEEQGAAHAEIALQPELVVRESTGRAPASPSHVSA